MINYRHYSKKNEPITTRSIAALEAAFSKQRIASPEITALREQVRSAEAGGFIFDERRASENLASAEQALSQKQIRQIAQSSPEIARSVFLGKADVTDDTQRSQVATINRLKDAVKSREFDSEYSYRTSFTKICKDTISKSPKRIRQGERGSVLSRPALEKNTKRLFKTNRYLRRPWMLPIAVSQDLVSSF